MNTHFLLLPLFAFSALNLVAAAESEKPTMRAVVVRPTVTPVLVRTPRVNDSVVRRSFSNSAEPLIVRGAFGPVNR